MNKRPKHSHWLDQIHGAVDADQPSEIIVPSMNGSVHIGVSKADIDNHFRRQKRHRRIIAGCYQVAMLVILAAGGALFTQDIDKQLGQYLAGSQIQEIAEEKAALEQAFSIYAEYTRDIVAEHRADLSSEVDALGANTSQVMKAASQTDGTGGALDDQSKITQVLDQYIDQNSAEQLYQIAQINHFLQRFPAHKPLRDSHVTSGFGMRKHPVTGHMAPHRGTDLVSWDQPNVIAAGDGRVVFAANKGKSGNMVTIDHGAGIETLYLHLAEIAVEQGQRVSAGDVIGVMGDTGQTDGAHLHYEIHVAGQAIDAAKMLKVASRGN